MSTTVRVSDRTRQRIAGIAATTGKQMQQVIDDAVDAYERDRFWEEFTRRSEALAADPAAAEEIESERAAEAGSLADGLNTDDPPRAK